ncbi:protein tyrosine/serine phosphatase [Paenibacillus alvei TS-15]|uniref:Protein tyrosine/serine phosphatase n=1 Tax=Paenibacillus alvei TS-15 TaxID=1117108 RepID=S9SPD8_PAEAL|nr:tyrosine-protein phosphatase [Paenibacillus alvei]EPY05958.1 protein tyrosine/serine phosphatase [Paenibacillus alvei TS-15]
MNEDNNQFEPKQNQTERIISLEGACNVRDLGGYQTKEGREIQWGHFYRGDGQHKLTEHDQELLLGRGIHTVIDLRHAQEVIVAKDAFADSDNVAYHNVDLLNPTTTNQPQVNSLGDLYVSMLDNSQDAFLRIFEILANPSDEAVLFHCTAGKDRTGMVAALLLELASVPHTTIIEDYAMTAECLLPIMDELRAGRPEGMPADLYERFLGCDPSNMEMMLQHLHAAYGGTERYLAAIGLSEEKVQILKQKLLEE